MFRADLHCHTTYSDGSYTPSQVIDLAVEAGLSGLSITDHDTIEAYAEAIPYAKLKGIDLLFGVELSADYQGHSVHMLAYAFDLESNAMQEFCAAHKKRREKRVRATLERVRSKGFDLPGELEEKKGVIGRPHIAALMKEKGFVHSIDEAFRLYLGEGRSCYVASETFSVAETLDVIEQAEGIPVIAHPHLIYSKKVVRALLEMPFKGIEGYYARMPLHKEQKWVDIGNSKGWIVTGGSDFHGEAKPKIPLGASWVGEEIFNTLKRGQPCGRTS